MINSRTIRAALKRSFPSTKFSIETRKSLAPLFIIRYTDGPTEREVKDRLKSFHKVSSGPSGDILIGCGLIPITDRTVTP